MRAVRAFTLVEMLVVMAVIGILMGIALPAMRMVRRESQNTECMSNLRQQFGAVTAYMASNKDVLPMCEFIPVATDDGPQGGLPALLAGHIEPGNEVWFCPGDDDADSRSTGTSYIYSPGLLRYAPTVQAEVLGLVLSFAPGSMSSAQLDCARLDAEARLMSAFYRANPGKYPLIVDSLDRHKRVGSQRNGVYLDGSVRPADPPAEDDAGGGAP